MSAFSRLIKCRICNRALTGQYSKGGRYAYYVCQSMIKLGKGACRTPRLNARRFEELIVGRIRSSILTETIIGDLKKVVAQELGELIREQRRRLDTIEFELADARRRLGRLWDLVETTDDDLGDTTQRIRAIRDRQMRLEASLEEAKVILSQRSAIRDDVEAIAANALDMTEFLKGSELSERKAYAETFVREIMVMPGKALVRYTIPISQSTPKTPILVGGRFGCDRVRSGGSTDWCATSTLMAGSILHRWARTQTMPGRLSSVVKPAFAPEVD